MKKVMLVFGTRPEAIKMCPLVNELKKRSGIKTVVCVTAQHRQMLDQVLETFNVVPDYDLDIMKDRQTLFDITTNILNGIKSVLEEVKPDVVLVHGDTSTTFVTALACFYLQIPVGHVEAGLRSFDKNSPYPEEMNRVLTGRLADIHFAPTASNERNLFNEGIKEHVYVTGNTVIDAIKSTVRKDYVFECPQLNDIDYEAHKVVLMTAHRRENYGQPMENIMQAVADTARERQDALFVYPVHLSPYVQQTARKYLEGIENVLLIPPLGVFDMHNLMSRVYMVMTDSGGLQEEAPALGKPVLVLRRETERPEAVKAGTVEVIGTEREKVHSRAVDLFEDHELYLKMKKAVNPYGDGDACRRISENILYFFDQAKKPSDRFGV